MEQALKLAHYTATFAGTDKEKLGKSYEGMQSHLMAFELSCRVMKLYVKKKDHILLNEIVELVKKARVAFVKFQTALDWVKSGQVPHAEPYYRIQELEAIINEKLPSVYNQLVDQWHEEMQ